jgi:hypothetical protein
MVKMLIKYRLNGGNIIPIENLKQEDFIDLGGQSLGNAEVIKSNNGNRLLAEAVFVIAANRAGVTIPSDRATPAPEAGVKQKFDFNGLVESCGFHSIEYRFDSDDNSAFVLAYPQHQ